MTNIVSEKALAVIKPDAMRRGIWSAVLGELFVYELELWNMQRRFLTLGEAQLLYAPHVGKDFYDELVKFMLSDEVMLIEVRGRECTKRLREAVDSIRKVYVIHGRPLRENIIHGSDSAEAGRREVELFFG
jgi:nucleoside-diphosphate kinase